MIDKLRAQGAGTPSPETGKLLGQYAAGQPVRVGNSNYTYIGPPALAETAAAALFQQIPDILEVQGMADPAAQYATDRAQAIADTATNGFTPQKMQEKAEGMVRDAVSSQLPGFTRLLIEGMMTGARVALDAGMTEAELRNRASTHVADFVGAFDPDAVDAAVTEVQKEIDAIVDQRVS